MVKLSSLAEDAVEKFCSNGIKEAIAPDILQEFSIKSPSFYSGSIASGDLFVGSHTQKKVITKDMPDVLAVDMEGASVAQVCFENDIPFVVIRTISDKADHSAAIDFPRFIAHVAKHYSKNIVKAMYEGWVLKKDDCLKLSEQKKSTTSSSASFSCSAAPRAVFRLEPTNRKKEKTLFDV